MCSCNVNRYNMKPVRLDFYRLLEFLYQSEYDKFDNFTDYLFFKAIPIIRNTFGVKWLDFKSR